MNRLLFAFALLTSFSLYAVKHKIIRVENHLDTPIWVQFPKKASFVGIEPKTMLNQNCRADATETSLCAIIDGIHTEITLPRPDLISSVVIHRNWADEVETTVNHEQTPLLRALHALTSIIHMALVQ